MIFCLDRLKWDDLAGSLRRVLAQWDAEDAEIKFAYADKPDLSNVSLCKASDRSEYSFACFACCQELGLIDLASFILPHIVLPT